MKDSGIWLEWNVIIKSQYNVGKWFQVVYIIFLRPKFNIPVLNCIPITHFRLLSFFIVRHFSVVVTVFLSFIRSRVFGFFVLFLVRLLGDSSTCGYRSSGYFCSKDKGLYTLLYTIGYVTFIFLIKFLICFHMFPVLSFTSFLYLYRSLIRSYSLLKRDD